MVVKWWDWQWYLRYVLCQVWLGFVCTGCMDLDARLEIYVGSEWDCKSLGYKLFSLVQLLSLWTPWWKRMVNWVFGWKLYWIHLILFSKNKRFVLKQRLCRSRNTLLSSSSVCTFDFTWCNPCKSLWYCILMSFLWKATRFLGQRFTKLTVVTCTRVAPVLKVVL